MATEKDFNQASFTQIAKDIEIFAHEIKTAQDQKQIVIDNFEKERKRMQDGKISKKSLVASIPKVRKELQRLNDVIRKNIQSLNRTAGKIRDFSMRQSPKSFIVTVSGIKSSGGAKKKPAPKKK
jgi:sulfate adenylyltransferase subunit 1 (EFTu-like GTPase family)